MSRTKKDNMSELEKMICELKNHDRNTYLLRIASMYIGGDYKGEDDYTLNMRKYRKCANNESRLKFCYSMLVHACKIEFGSFVNVTLLTQMLKANIDDESVEWFNNELLEIAYDLYVG